MKPGQEFWNLYNHGLVRVAVAVPEVRVADPSFNAAATIVLLERAAEAHAGLAASHPWEAQYVVPLAYKVRYVLQANLRELFHLVELRSARQGHESYRQVAQQLADGVLEVMPWLAPFLRVDRAAYPWARH